MILIDALSRISGVYFIGYITASTWNTGWTWHIQPFIYFQSSYVMCLAQLCFVSWNFFAPHVAEETAFRRIVNPSLVYWVEPVNVAKGNISSQRVMYIDAFLTVRSIWKMPAPCGTRSSPLLLEWGSYSGWKVRVIALVCCSVNDFLIEMWL